MAEIVKSDVAQTLRLQMLPKLGTDIGGPERTPEAICEYKVL
jgi:hypothetical protein